MHGLRSKEVKRPQNTKSYADGIKPRELVVEHEGTDEVHVSPALATEGLHTLPNKPPRR
jgi:hypothetical protein